MTAECWNAVDRYLTELLVRSDPVLDAALAANSAAKLPRIDVSPLQGKLLHLLARLSRARMILEIGTLGGYSTIWLARALPSGGRLISLERSARYAAVAQKNIAQSGFEQFVDVRVGRALDTLPVIEAEGLGPFDLIFMDADWVNNPQYLVWALRLSRPGTLIVVDNVVRAGAVIDADNAAPGIQGMRWMLELLSNEPRLSATAIQTVGSKGHDGFVIAYVNEDASR
ncbi:MAG: O-methyltransferase [Pseudomonadota bacterium]|nr:O-methyltransferase [Pseudomonadota bacterium]